MTLTPRPSIDDILGAALPSPVWRLELLFYRDDLWEVHLVHGPIVWFGYGESIESAIDQALLGAGGSFNRAQRPRHDQPAHPPALQAILNRLKPAKVVLNKRI